MSDLLPRTEVFLFGSWVRGMNWNEVTAVCAILTLGGTIHIFVVISIVRKELEKTYQRIYGTYVRSELFNQYRQSVEAHFDFLRDEHRHDHSAR